VFKSLAGSSNDDTGRTYDAIALKCFLHKIPLLGYGEHSLLNFIIFLFVGPMWIKCRWQKWFKKTRKFLPNR